MSRSWAWLVFALAFGWIGCTEEPTSGEEGSGSDDASVSDDTLQDAEAADGSTPLLPDAEYGGEPCDDMDCNDDKPCTTDSCENGFCYNFPLDNGSPCEDGNLCTQDESCDPKGDCTGGVGVQCEDASTCTSDVCEIEVGCVFINLEDGTVCDDGNNCSIEDTCKNGVCDSGAELTCDDDNACTVLQGCDPVSGKCLFLDVPDGAFCEDGNACTDTDLCLAGKCTSGALLVCNDDNPCTNDNCNPKAGCEFFPNDLACDDGTLCTTDDACLGGQCVGTALGCDDGNLCTSDGCTAETGCVWTPVTVACDDGNPCTVNDACAESQCVGGAPKICSSGDDCVVGQCELGTGNCLFTAIEDGFGCDDGNSCSVGETCEGGVCSGFALLCDDENPCTVDTCDPQAGCVFESLEGQACDDGESCTDQDQCLNGVCSGNTTECDDENACTVDMCNDNLGCIHLDLPGSECDDGISCTTDSCDPASGCTHVPDDTVCGSGEACLTDVCDPQVGCTTDLTPNCCGNGLIEDGEECDDGNEAPGDGCSNCVNDETNAGSCIPGVPISSIGTTGDLIMNGLSISLTTPPGVQAGDLLLALVTTNNFSTTSPPAGWAILDTNANGQGANCGSSTFYRFASEADPGSHVFAFTNETYASGVMTAYRNVDTTIPIAATSSQSTGGYTPAPVTTQSVDSMLVLLLSSGNGMNSWSTPSGWVLDYFGQQNATSAGAFHRDQSEIGPSEAVTAPSSTLDVGVAHLLALNSCGIPTGIDGCPEDPNKTEPGVCGCGTPDTDSDGDGTPNCIDGCPSDPDSITEGQCGSGTCVDNESVSTSFESPEDGTVGVGGGCNAGCFGYWSNTADAVAWAYLCDGEATPCPSPFDSCSGTCDTGITCEGGVDNCPDDPDKVDPGACGCGIADTDSDGDATPDCVDECPDDAGAIFGEDCEGICTGSEPVNVPFDTAEGTTSSVSGPCNFGCFGYWSDTANAVAYAYLCDGIATACPSVFDSCSGTCDTGFSCEGSVDNCPDDPDKVDPGACGCGIADTDSDGDATPDCVDECPDDAGAIFGEDCEGICTGSEPVNVPFDTAEGTTSSVSGPCNFGCFGYWSDTANAVAYAYLCDGIATSCPSVYDSCSGNCDTGFTCENDDEDLCPSDPNKTEPGLCGCGVEDSDTDGDGTPNCLDDCPNNPNATESGQCDAGTCQDNEPVNIPFETADGTTSSVSGGCNAGCFGYWSDSANAVAWAYLCNGIATSCPSTFDSCSGSCAEGITCQ